MSAQSLMVFGPCIQVVHCAAIGQCLGQGLYRGLARAVEDLFLRLATSTRCSLPKRLTAASSSSSSSSRRFVTNTTNARRFAGSAVG